MGDPASLDHKLAEVSQNIEKLRLEAQKFEVGKSCCGKALLEKKKKQKWVEGSRDAYGCKSTAFLSLREMQLEKSGVS